ncbi:MAG TPA: hypothetical protein VMQ51_07840, partial [Candidatus Binatia bacterium]|nr:hypothetical protein [Candidatus Binatia bacterium]
MGTPSCRGIRRAIRHLRLLLVAAILLGGWGAAGAHGTQGARVDPAILAAFDFLALSIDSLAAGILPPGQRIGLLGRVRDAERAYRRHHPCVAAHVLGAYLQESQALRRGRRQGVGEELYNQGRRLRDDLVAAVSAAHPCHDPRAALADADVRLRTSDNLGLAALVTFGRPRFETRRAGGEVWTAVEVPGLRVGMDG